MTTDARIVAPQQKIGARPLGTRPPAQPEPAPEPEKPKRSRSRGLGIIIGVAIMVVAAGGYWFLAGPGASTETAAEETVELGDVQVLDPISINLADGHYLRLGLGLQLTADAHAEVGAAMALDAAIALFAGRDQHELMDATVRDQLKDELAATLSELYHGEVVGAYYTDFVTQ